MNDRAAHRPKGPSSLSPAQRAGHSCRQIMRPEGPRSAAAAWVVACYRAPLGRMNVSVARYPARWAGHSCRQIMRPEGPRYAAAAWVVAGYRAPLGRMNVSVVRYPARWAGLRDSAPLALKALGQLEAEIQQGMKELEGMLK